MIGRRSTTGGPATQSSGMAWRLALLVSLLWLLGAAATLLGMRQAGGAVTTLAAVVMLAVPVGFIWAAAIAARTVADLRADVRALRSEMDTLRRAAAPGDATPARPALGNMLSALAARAPLAPEPPEPEPRDDARATPDPDPALTDAAAPDSAGSDAPSSGAAQAPADSADGSGASDAAPDEPATEEEHGDPAPAAAQPLPAAAFTTTRKRQPAAVTPPRDEQQLALSLGPEAQAGAVPLPLPMIVRALNFPDSETDSAGFQALRHALEDPITARLVRASQDVLTLLAEDGIYMDDLQHDRARPDIWRRFAQGERGPGVGTLGGIRDRSSLTVTAGRMRNDPVFRDTAHHFLRQFDRVFVGYEARADDAAIAALAETRTARAFMLIGRVIGLFD